MFTLECAQYVANRLEEEGYEGDVREDYSGRGMYGKTAVAICTDAPGTLIGMFVGEYNAQGFDARPPTRTDSMGLGRVFY